MARTYDVDGWNNFCRVFELPQEYSEEFCFGGGQPTNFQMVDWFNPVSPVSADSKPIDLDELELTLVPWLRQKKYVKPGRRYLVLYDFGASTTFEGGSDDVAP